MHPSLGVEKCDTHTSHHASLVRHLISEMQYNWLILYTRLEIGHPVWDGWPTIFGLQWSFSSVSAFIRLQHNDTYQSCCETSFNPFFASRSVHSYVKTLPLLHLTVTGNYHKQGLLWAHASIGASRSRFGCWSSAMFGGKKEHRLLMLRIAVRNLNLLSTFDVIYDCGQDDRWANVSLPYLNRLIAR
jgi:hypothetical protein